MLRVEIDCLWPTIEILMGLKWDIGDKWDQSKENTPSVEF
jgi:hypothetical protein